MRLDFISQNPQDLMILTMARRANLIPMPLVHGFLEGAFSRVYLTASRLRVFEAIKDGPQTLEELAHKTGLNPGGLYSIMSILILLGYINYKNGRFSLKRTARKFCLDESTDSTYFFDRYAEIMLKYLDSMEGYLRDGKGQGIHDTMPEEEWNLYQLGMEYLARDASKAAAKMMPMPPNPTEMLDIGGSHGLFSVELCKKYPNLNATILELPEAIVKAQPILAKFNMGDRIKYQSGNVLTDDLGENKYDLVLMSSLMHHLTAEQNVAVSKKIARALKPGGYFSVQEYLKPEISKKSASLGDIIAMTTNLVFNVTSAARTLTIQEIKQFQAQAGLAHHKVGRFGIMLPSFILVCAQKV
jgi:ubiquinone/menaquinone biosynthesis C-methylase UbiE